MYKYRPPKIYSLTAILFSIFVVIAFWYLLKNLDTTNISAYGSFLGAGATAITLCWMVAGFWLQRHIIDKQSHDQVLQRALLRQQTILPLIDRHIASMDIVAIRIYKSLYVKNKVASFQGNEAATLLLQKITLSADLREAFEGGNFLPLIHASSYIDKYQALMELFVPDPELEQHDAGLRKLIEGSHTTALGRRLQSAIQSLPELGTDGNLWK